MPTLTTPRLSLRRLAEGDIDGLLILEADPEVMRFSTGAIPPSAERRAGLLEHLQRAPGPIGHWAIERNGQFIGWISLTPLEDTPHIQLAYRLVRSAWGNGYATEAGAALLTHGFATLGLGQIAAVVWPEHAASIRVLEKLGFTYVGERHHYARSVSLFLSHAAPR